MPAVAGSGWQPVGSMSVVHRAHAAALLTDGRVLVAGGADDARDASATGEAYDPATGLWTPTTGAMSDGRENLHAALLDDGRVLVAGGFTLNPTVTFRTSADVYDPATNGWSATGALATERGQGGTAVLPDGRVLAAGGVNRRGYVASVELYDPAAGSWSPGGSIPHTGNVVTAASLDDGRALIQVDSNASTVLFDPAADAVDPVQYQASSPRSLASLTGLEDGRVLMAGGGNLASTELFTPPTERNAIAAGDFDARVGAGVERDVTVENSGGNRLWIDGTALAGAAAADYALVADGCTGEELLPGEGCVVRVRFEPSARGARPAELTFDDNAEQSPALALDGEGTVRPSPPDPPRPPTPITPAPPTPEPPRPPVSSVPPPAPEAPPTTPAPRRPTARAPAIERFALASRCVRPLPGDAAQVGLVLKLTRHARVRIETARAIGTRGRTLCPPRGHRGRFDGALASPRSLARGATRTAIASSVTQRYTLRLRLRPALYRVTVRPYTGPRRLGRPAVRWLRVLAP